MDAVEREALVREAGRRWRAQLIDLGGRNTLLYYRDLKAGTLDLGSAVPLALAVLLSGRPVPLAQLFGDPPAHAAALRRARTIRNKARELAEERGVEAGYLAIGMATWASPKGGSTPAAPVLLRPALLRARGAAEEDFDLVLAPDVDVNPTLLHLLANDFDVTVDPEELEDLVEKGTRAGFDPAAVFERLVKEAAGRVRGFTIGPRYVLGTFSYAKLPMVTDLLAAEHLLAEHEVIAAIAGDRGAQQAVRERTVTIDPRAPDSIAPADEFLVLDADSSQQVAINAVIAGQHTVIKGPPGTGKSQTIANLIATLVAQGKRVLFVAEKRAAITAVTDRLTRRGLGDLVLDVHDGAISRRRVAAELRDAFESASRIALPDLTVVAERLVDRRRTLAGHVEALHGRREPWGVSVFEAREALIRYGVSHPGVSTAVRLSGPELLRLDAAAARRAGEQLHDFVTLGGLTVTVHDSPWAAAEVTTPEQTTDAHALAAALSTRTLPQTRPWLEAVLTQTGVVAPARMDEWQTVFTLLDGVGATLASFRPAVYDAGLPEMLAATAPSTWRRQHPDAPGARAGWWRRRRLREHARALYRGIGKPTREELFELLSLANSQGRQWTRVARDSGVPRIPADLVAAQAAWQRLAAELAALDRYVPSLGLSTMDVERLTSTLARLTSDERALRMVARRNGLGAGLSEAGLDPLIAELRERGARPEQAGVLFDLCWYSSILAYVGFADPRVGAFDGILHTRVADEYRDSDARHLDAATARVLRAVAEHITDTRDAYPDESQLVEHQANLKRRHLPIRAMFARAPHMLTALKPCWAMSPLVVSQLLPADGPYFDVVVFDEASQITPADAIPAILRARQLVVAGDEHQLPPTAFFTAADEDTEPVGVTGDGAIDLSLTAGFESILDVAAALIPSTLLRWHYRSLDDRLIGFSNANIYDRALVTFPGTAGPGALRHVLVAGVSPLDGSEDLDAPAPMEPLPSPASEVERVVELVLEHAATRPHESLGVITMGVPHAERVDLALRTALAGRPELDGFFAERAAAVSGAPEPFFVKNLERVQGDERDAIIFTIGYGKAANGSLPYRFGPLLQAGGERRLNVAITRARRRMTVVSAFTAAEMDPGRSNAAGVRLLRAYLAYAASGGADLGTGAGAQVAPGAFANDVLLRLSAAGIPVTSQYGLAGYAIDFAASHPTRPDQPLLAIETDGPRYAASNTVRDRDRLRPEHLARLGWRFHRIWSPDWFTDPDQQVALVRAAYEESIARVEGGPMAAETVILPLVAPIPASRPGWEPPRSVPEGAAAWAPRPAPVRPAPPAPVRPAPPAPVRPAPPAPVRSAPPAQPGGWATADATAEQVSPWAPRAGRPDLRPGLGITEYASADLVALIRWIESDTLLRTEDEIVDEVMRELGFRRRGPRIHAVVLNALREARGEGSP